MGFEQQRLKKERDAVQQQSLDDETANRRWVEKTWEEEEKKQGARSMMQVKANLLQG